MIFPTAIDILRNIQQTHDAVLCPALTGSTARSAGATVSHLLRHVALRIEKEGQILVDDIVLARALLRDMRDYLATLPDDTAAARIRDIDALLGRSFRAADSYPTLCSMADEAAALREVITGGLEFLQSIRVVRRQEQAYSEIRWKIACHMAEQIRREAELVEPAFADRGPRR